MSDTITAADLAHRWHNRDGIDDLLTRYVSDDAPLEKARQEAQLALMRFFVLLNTVTPTPPEMCCASPDAIRYDEIKFGALGKVEEA